MADESLYLGATIRERLIAVLSRDDETVAHRLAPFLAGPEGLDEQRAEAWHLLSAGSAWAAKALSSVGIDGTDESSIRDADAAFHRAQHLDEQLLKLSLREGYSDEVAVLVDSVKQACYRGADLGPLPGGRLGSFRGPAGNLKITQELEPSAADLQEIGAALGEALIRLGKLNLGDPVLIVGAVFPPVPADSR